MALAEKWVLDHQEPTGDWGGIQPAMLNSILALHCLGYANDHPAVIKGLEALANFCIEDEDEPGAPVLHLAGMGYGAGA